MADVRLVFSGAPVPTPGPVPLVFGVRETPVAQGVRLVFRQAPVPTPGAVRLVFGESDQPAPSIPDATLSGAAQVTGLRLRIGIRTGAQVQSAAQVTGLRLRVSLQSAAVVGVAARVTGLRLRIAAVYDVNVQRPTVGQTRGVFQGAMAAQASTTSRYSSAAKQPAAWRAHWQDAARAAAGTRTRWQDNARAPMAVVIAYQQAQRVPVQPVVQRYQQAQAMPHAVVSTMQQAQRVPVEPVAQRFQQAIRLRSARASAYQQAQPRGAAIATHMGYALALQKRWGGRYQQAMHPQPGRWVPPAPPGPTPCYVPTLPALLLFSDDYTAQLPARLLFTCERPGPGPQPGETVVVPIRRVYIVLNSITLTRVDTGAPLHALSFSASLDVDSWTWQWSATLHDSAGEHLARNPDGTPPEVLATVNGLPLRLRLERVRLQEQFLPQRRYSVSGRGRNAILASPWAPVMQHGGQATERTAQQLANEVLTINGVGIGWGVDWQIADWTVPSGVWTQRGSYIDALADIASSVGAYIQPHATDATVRVLPRYPAKPWEWGGMAPDFQIPKDATQQIGTEYLDKPAYNGIYVGGVQAGVFGPVHRAGTVGDVQAPQVTHPLITDATAHRMRGIAELADTGKQRRVQLSMQVLPETGLILPGKLVQVGSGAGAMRGLVRGTAIEWGSPRLRQNIELEVHD